MRLLLGPIFSPIIGGLIVDTASWRCIFVVAYAGPGAIGLGVILHVAIGRAVRPQAGDAQGKHGLDARTARAPVAELLELSNANDTNAVLATFVEAGVVNDWGREFVGTDAIGDGATASSSANTSAAKSAAPNRTVRRRW